MYGKAIKSNHKCDYLRRYCTLLNASHYVLFNYINKNELYVFLVNPAI